MEENINYVVGFAFSTDKRSVLLIRKRKPEWQRGKLNGIGGRIEDGESPIQAMCREFEEETGVASDSEDWHCFACLSAFNPAVSHRALIYFFVTFNDIMVDRATTTTPEEVLHVNVTAVIKSRFEGNRFVPNLRWLIPMAIDMDLDSVAGFEIREAGQPLDVNFVAPIVAAYYEEKVA